MVAGRRHGALAIAAIIAIGLGVVIFLAVYERSSRGSRLSPTSLDGSSGRSQSFADVENGGTTGSRNDITTRTGVWNAEPVVPRDLIEGEARQGIKLLDIRDRVPVSDLHRDRVSAINKEDVTSLVRNLADFDDMQFAQTSIRGRFRPGSPASVSEMLPNSFRVRRLLEIGTQNPSELTETMQDVLRIALREWPEALKAELALWERSAGGLRKLEPTPHDQVEMRATVATYLLAELGRPEALPCIHEAFLQQRRWIEEIPETEYRYTPQAPVPPPISLFAMHRLVSVFPVAHLSAEGQQARQEYLSWAQERIPEPETIQGVRADSEIDESDPMYKIIDPEGALVAHAKKLTLVVYPTTFKDGAPMQKYETAPYLTEAGEEWCRRLSQAITVMRQGQRPAE